MSTPEEIKKWLKKLKYPGPVPADDQLQKLCKGAISLVFKQIVDKVKPKQEIEYMKQNILINRLHEKKSSNSNSERNKQIKMYNSRRNLEKELHEIKQKSRESETNLEHIITKVTDKNAEIQCKKIKILECERECVLLKAKSAELDKQIVNCEKLYQDSLILDKEAMNCEKEEIEEKIRPILSKFSDIIDQNTQNPPTPIAQTSTNFSAFKNHVQTSADFSAFKNHVPTSADFSAFKNHIPTSADFSAFKSHVQATDIFSSTKTVFSTAKRPNQPYDTNRKTRRNLFKYTFDHINDTTVTPNSTLGHGFAEMYTGIMNDIETSIWNDPTLRTQVDQLWKMGCENIFGIIMEKVTKDKKRITDLVVEKCSRKSVADSKPNDVIGIDKLYNYYLQYELERRKCETAQRKSMKLFDIQLQNDVNPILLLEAAEYGLQQAILQFTESCNKFEVQNTTNIDNILQEIQEIEAEMLSKKAKIETNLRLLDNCNSWLEKIHENVLGRVVEFQFHPQYEILNSQSAKCEMENFIHYPFQRKNQSYMDSWAKVYDDPQLLEIIQRPYYAPEHVLGAHISENLWLKKLLRLQKEISCHKFDKQLNVFKSFDNLKVDDPSNDKLQKSMQVCHEIRLNMSNFNTEIQLWLESPLNQCVEPTIKYNNKLLSEYVAEYDELYKKIAK